MHLSKTSTPRRLSRWVVGVVLALALLALLFIFGKPRTQNFSSEDKTQIQRIANELCAAASERSCEVSWGGKSKWFGTLEPSSAGAGKVGLDHIRKALPAPSWQENSDSNGVVFRTKDYEVFYSPRSGAVSITRAAGADTP
jgi:hypothetical protein